METSDENTALHPGRAGCIAGLRRRQHHTGHHAERDELQRKWDGFGRQGTAGVTIRTVLKWSREAGASVGSPVASPDDFEILEDTPEEAAERKAKADRFAVIPASEILGRKPPGWLVKDTIPDAELVLVYGASGSGKSFVMIHPAMALARGTPWFGRKVRQSPVVYVCAEGAGGFGKRLRAYALQQGLDLKDVPLGVSFTALVHPGLELGVQLAHRLLGFTCVLNALIDLLDGRQHAFDCAGCIALHAGHGG